MTVCKWVLTFAHLLNWPESCCWMCCDCNQQNWAWVLCKEEKKGFKKGRRRGECKSNCPHTSKQMPETCSRLSNKLSTIDPGCFVPAFPWPPLPKPASRECIRRSSSEINPVQHKKEWVCVCVYASVCACCMTHFLTRCFLSVYVKEHFNFLHQADMFWLIS